MTATVPFVDGIGVLLAIGRAGLSGVNVYQDIPEKMLDHLPALTISRAGGNSESPKFNTAFFCHFQVWSDATSEYPDDPRGATFALSRRVEQCFFNAWQNQTVALDADDNPLGWIARWRESSGFQKLDDPDLPIGVSRYVAVYDLLIRNPRPSA